MIDTVTLNQYGYYELKEKPSKDELDDFYSNAYYQSEHKEKVDPLERRYIQNQNERKAFFVSRHFKTPGSLIDIGCGCGWTLQYFKEKGWDVTGIDFSLVGCQRENPDLVSNILEGDTYQRIEQLIEKGEKYHVLILDNVLEHVLDPLQLVKKLKKIAHKNHLLIVRVPNDFNPIQMKLLEDKVVTHPFWVRVPDHISYFNLDGLKSLMEEGGFQPVEEAYCEYPIDLNLFNQETNYIHDPTKGHSVHLARMEIDAFFHQRSVKETIKLYQQFMRLGVGRNIVALFSAE